MASSYRLVLAYDGTEYRGWQTQPRDLTVQGVVVEAARRAFGPRVRVIGASRTDAGVHALRQTASLATEVVLPASAVQGALNAGLPRDVRVLEAHAAPAGFDARRAAIGKRYGYLIDTGPIAHPLLRRFAWHVPSRLDVASMRAALGPLRGRHDFTSFCAAPGRDKDPVCRVRAIHVVARRGRLAILLSADRYLHHMVRTIVGSAVDVGRGKRDPRWLADVLGAGDRRLAGATAPARGLTLLRVVYER